MQSSLYHNFIVEHSRQPRHYGALECATVSSQATNRLCGDSVIVYVRLDTGSASDDATSESRIESVAFTAKACALTVSSASLMTTLLHAKTESDARQMMKSIEQFLRCTASLPDDMQDWQAFEGVHTNPSRIKCVLLPWQALMNAFEQVHTEQSRRAITP